MSIFDIVFICYVLRRLLNLMDEDKLPYINIGYFPKLIVVSRIVI